MNFFKQIFQSDLLHGKRTKIFLFKCLGLGKFFSIQNCQLPNQRRKNWMKRDRIPKTCKIYLDRSFNCLKKVATFWMNVNSQLIFKVQIKTKHKKFNLTAQIYNPNRKIWYTSYSLINVNVQTTYLLAQDIAPFHICTNEMSFAT